MQLTVPLAPVIGVEQDAAGPVFCTSDTNVAPFGNGSVKFTFCAISGPPFETVMVYVTLLPDMAAGGPIFATDRSTDETVTSAAA